jgi:hypothetical protein
MVSFEKADWLFTVQEDGRVLIEAPLGSAPGANTILPGGRRLVVPPGRLIVRLTPEEWRGVIEPVSSSISPGETP